MNMQCCYFCMLPFSAHTLFQEVIFHPTHIPESLSLVLIMTLIVHFHSILCIVLLFSCTLFDTSTESRRGKTEMLSSSLMFHLLL